MGICRRDFAKLALGGLAARLAGAATRPKLLVLVVLGQCRQDYLDQVHSQFAPAGFRRLYEKGTIFNDCSNRATTFPTTSIATLATGAWPAQHGIVADSWYERSTKEVVKASEDELLATTLAAQLAPGDRTRSFIVGTSETHAGLFAGSSDSRLYWMDEEGRFATRGDAPEWLASYNEPKVAEGVRNRAWQALGARPDAPALRTLNFDPAHPREFMTLYKSSPYGQAAQFDFATELLAREKLGTSNSTDLLVILSESTELLGYETGARSALMQQMILHIDRRIEALLMQLGKATGETGFNLVVCGAHGAPLEPPSDQRERMSIQGEKIAQAVEKALIAGTGGHVEKYLYPFLYLDSSGFRDPDPIRIAAARAALQQPGVAGYFTAGGVCSTYDEWERRFRSSFHPVRSGDVMLSYAPEFVEDYGQKRGISYGSLYNYDVKVPLFFYGPSFRPGSFESPVELVDVAPTLARVLGVSAGSSSVGRILGEALAG